MTDPEPDNMLLRNRVPALEQVPVPGKKSFEQIDDSAIAILRWLNANRVDYVLVGAVARIARGQASGPNQQTPRGPVVIAPAPYGRNLDRLARGLWAARARLRVDGPLADGAEQTVPVKVSAEKLIRPERWTLRCGSYDLDIEGRPPGVPRYQELLYEAAKLELAEGVAVEVASPEDIEHYEHMRRTGLPPEIRVLRAARV